MIDCVAADEGLADCFDADVGVLAGPVHHAAGRVAAGDEHAHHFQIASTVQADVPAGAADAQTAGDRSAGRFDQQPETPVVRATGNSPVELDRVGRDQSCGDVELFTSSCCDGRTGAGKRDAVLADRPASDDQAKQIHVLRTADVDCALGLLRDDL